MLSIIGSHLGLSGQSSRREILKLGSLGLLGLGLPDLLRGRAQAEASKRVRPKTFGKAKSCVILWVKGGPSQIDMFDMKPSATAQVRGEFRPISTSATGLSICEHLPFTAQQAHRLTVVRSMCHDDTNHASAAYWMTTGFAYPRPLNLANESTREDHPHFGSSLSSVEASRVQGENAAPPFVMVPRYLVVNGELRSGQYAGVLGARHDPMTGAGDPSSPDLQFKDMGLNLPVGPERFRNRHELRKALLDQLKALAPDRAGRDFDANYQKAYSLLEAGVARRAFDIDAEPSGVRDRYGKSLWGQSVLLGRRLVEAGVRLVHVNWVAIAPDLGWDTHTKNSEQLKTILLPKLDRAFAALLDDLASRGLLDETLVVLAGEFGRTPRINKDAGRDHWANAFSVVLAGAGLPGGRTFGATDAQGASVVEGRMTPADLTATVFHALGIDPESQVNTLLNRPWRICDGRPVLSLWS